MKALVFVIGCTWLCAALFKTVMPEHWVLCGSIFAASFGSIWGVIERLRCELDQAARLEQIRKGGAL